MGMTHRRAVAAGVVLAALWLPVGARALGPDAITVDGGRYFGPLVDGKLDGTGRVEWSNGSRYEGGFREGLLAGRGRFEAGTGAVYEGEFKDGRFDGPGKYTRDGEEYEGQFRDGDFTGQGEIRYPDGRRYRGAVDAWRPHGQGIFEDAGGGVYEGEFVRGAFTGSGIFTAPGGMRHEGAFQNWRPHGQGTFKAADGAVYEGQFSNGELQGVGRYTLGDGTRYEGELKAWRAHGKGELHSPNGDVYKGEFELGVFSGQGTLTYAQPQDDGRTQDVGLWRYGSFMPREQEEQRRARANAEAALYAQPGLLHEAISQLQASDPQRIHLYLLAVAGDGTQEVFRREVEFVRDQFDRGFGTQGRSLALVNSRSTVQTVPMASLTSIRQALKAMAAKMDTARDILFLFLTSHGSSTHEISLGLEGMSLPGLSAGDLAAALQSAGIRWKVIVLSACYAGGFADALRDPQTLLIAAARADRRSFGCADENDFTYFGRAFFKEALPGSASFQEAFAKAQSLVTQWELRDLHSKPAGNDARGSDSQTGADGPTQHSLPQMEVGAAIEAHLLRWWAQPRPGPAPLEDAGPGPAPAH